MAAILWLQIYAKIYEFWIHNERTNYCIKNKILQPPLLDYYCWELPSFTDPDHSHAVL